MNTWYVTDSAQRYIWHTRQNIHVPYTTHELTLSIPIYNPWQKTNDDDKVKNINLITHFVYLHKIDATGRKHGSQFLHFNFMCSTGNIGYTLPCRYRLQIFLTHLKVKKTKLDRPFSFPIQLNRNHWNDTFKHFYFTLIAIKTEKLDKQPPKLILWNP